MDFNYVDLVGQYVIYYVWTIELTSDLPCQLFYGMVWEEERKRKKRCGGKTEEELGGIGLFGLFARISKPARQ